MKIKSIATVFLLLAVTVAVAQPGENAKMRVESQRITFITQRLSLTPQEGEKF